MAETPQNFAFPTAEQVFRDPYDHGMRELIMHEARGMTLRDYFAAKALTGIVSNGAMLRVMSDGVPSPEDQPTVLAHVAYAIADAMLAERNK